jgi:cell division protein FtsQ
LKQESKAWVNQASRRLTDPDRSFMIDGSSQASSSLPPSVQAREKDHFFRVGWRLVSLILSVAFAFGIYSFWNAPEYRISNIYIQGLQRITEEDVLSKMDLIGQRIYAIDKDEIKTSLQRAYPELWDIAIHLVMPNQVSIRLVERQPMIAWDMGDIQLWIDAEGYLIPARGENQDMLTIKADALPTYQLAGETARKQQGLENEMILNIVRDKPVIKGGYQESLFFAFPKQITSDLLTAILQLNAWMPDEKELLYESVRGVGWKDARGWNVFIGSKLESINDKMLMYETIIRQLDDEGIKPAMVSVEFLHAPYYRMGN